MRALSLAIALTLLGTLPTATVSADDAAAARFHDQRAREHYRRGRYEQAIREFFLEQRIAPNPRILFNIALCFRLLGEDAEAFQMYAEYLASDDRDETRRAQATAALEALAPQVARIDVRTDPPGARIYVDQEEHGSYGQSPSVVAVEPGEHRIFVALDGHRGAETTISAERGEEIEVALTLEAITGALEVTSSQPGQARVRTPGGVVVAEGATPLSANLHPGPYEVEVSSEGHESHRGLAEVRVDASVRHEARLLALPEARGTLTVTANQPGALISIDGTPAGFTPLVLEDLSVGEHEMAVEREGLDPWRGTVAVDADTPTWVTLTLQDEDAATVHSPATWVLGGTGLAALAAGGVVGLFALDTRSEFDDAVAQRRPDVDELRQRGETLNIVADGLAGVGLATLIAAVVVFVVEELGEPVRSSAAVSQAEGVADVGE